MTMMMMTNQVAAAASRGVLVMMMAATTMLMVAATSSSPVETAADPSVTIRLIVSSGRAIDPSICTDADWNILIHAVVGNNKKSAVASSSSSSSWCQVYCTEFGRSSCWLAHPACHQGDDSGLIVDEDDHHATATMIGMLSEMELLLPDINDNDDEAHHGDFTPAMRASCLAQRAVALQAVNNAMVVQDNELSSPCRRALQQRRIIADCVMISLTEEGVALVE
jgi:hypothetical protein